MSSVIDEHVVRAVRDLIDAEGPQALRVDDLTEADLPRIAWSGASHVWHVEQALARVPLGEVEYLAARAPRGEPVAKLGIDYRVMAEVGTMWQLVVHDELQRLGIATSLIATAEQRIRDRGRTTAELGVELDNHDARSLYERLGYAEVRREGAGWDVIGEDGERRFYTTELAILRKRL